MWWKRKIKKQQKQIPPRFFNALDEAITELGETIKNLETYKQKHDKHL